MFATASVDSHEGRNVATFDILGAYLHTKIYKDVIMFMEVSRSEIMVKVAPNKYQKRVIVTIKVNRSYMCGLKIHYMDYCGAHCYYI